MREDCFMLDLGGKKKEDEVVYCIDGYPCMTRVSNHPGVVPTLTLRTPKPWHLLGRVL